MIHSEHHRKHKYPNPPSLAKLGLEDPEPQKRKSGKALTKPKKFRFQLLHDWLTDHYDPCRLADIGGGKGLLSYMLQQNSWNATVVDPYDQSLPTKYKDINSGSRVRISKEETVPRLARSFEPAIAQNFDLLLGLHAHGCNLSIIDAAKSHYCDFVLMPCCVIDEPSVPPPNIHWLPWLANYATQKGFEIEFFKLNFKGQNIGFRGKRAAI
ncbi:MAG: hypothetical protein QGG64_15875 [Candidatus Latescibacteria bacterium]|nr:hypothetical protein [Candidatus Latescibacterota bacterium]